MAVLTELFSLQGRVILVTGGYGHLGRAICKGLAEHGAHVFVPGRSRETFRATFRDEAPAIDFVDVDLRSTPSIAAGFRKVYETTGRIDVLVNNAFYSRGQSPEALDDADWAYGVDGTLGSAYRCIREVLPYMKTNGRGKIINVASMYGVASPDFRVYAEHPSFLNPPHYGAAKAGLIQLTRYFGVYLARQNIQVNAVSPGPFPSDDVAQNTSFVKTLASRVPMGRTGHPDELKGVFVFLASDASSFMTGQNLTVDGGWTAV